MLNVIWRSSRAHQNEETPVNTDPYRGLRNRRHSSADAFGV